MRACSPQSTRPTNRCLLIDALALGVFCFLIYTALLRYDVLFQNGEWNWRAVITGNETSHFELVRAIVEGRTFAIENFRAPVAADIASYGGHLYSNKPPGFAFLNAPLYAVFFYGLLPFLKAKPVPNFLPLLSIAMGGLTVSLTYLLAIETGRRRWSAAFCALVAGLGTIVLVYAPTFLNHVASAAVLLLTLWSGLRYRATRRPAFLIVAAFCAAYSVLLNYTAAVINLPLLVYVLWEACRARAKRAIALALLAGMLPLLVLAFYNWRCFDSPFATAYSYYLPPPSIKYEGPQEAFLGGSFVQGIWGLLFGAARGIFVYTPVLLLAFPGLFLQLKQQEAVGETLVLVATFGLNVLLFASYRYWFGGHSIGARHILPVIPLVAILVGPCLERLPPWGRWISVLLALPSVVVHIMLSFLFYDLRALAQSWLENEGNRLGNMYTEILPFFTTTQVDIAGAGAFRVMKVTVFVLVVTLACYLGWRWRQET